MEKVKKIVGNVHTGYGHRAKKSMGQNFLKSVAALRMMCTAGDVNENDTVVEIGPGKGALTSHLLERAKRVIAVELDRDLIDMLKVKFKEEIETGKLELIQKDILKFDPKEQGIVSEYKIIANIPYNITGAIIKRFLSETTQPSAMVLLVQKEVAERIVARVHTGYGQGKESILSLSVKAYGTPTYMMKVGKRFFSPSPKVDSAIIAINHISKANFKTNEEEQRFFTLIKAGFAHKRKVLRKNLELITSQHIIEDLFKHLNIDEKIRAEDVPLAKWIAINEHLAGFSIGNFK